MFHKKTIVGKQINLNKIGVNKSFWSKENAGGKKIWSKNILGNKKFCGPKNGVKNDAKKELLPKNILSQKILAQKKKNVYGHKKLLVQKNFSPKVNFVIKF